MLKRSQRSSERSPEPQQGDRLDGGSATQQGKARKRARKPYQRPVVQKRKSVAEATLFSGSGVSGTLVS